MIDVIKFSSNFDENVFSGWLLFYCVDFQVSVKLNLSRVSTASVGKFTEMLVRFTKLALMRFILVRYTVQRHYSCVLDKNFWENLSSSP